jgi:cyanophycin synthetase
MPPRATSNTATSTVGSDKITSAERVKEGGTLILNADDGRLAGLMDTPRVKRVQKKVVYYSLDHEHPLVRSHAERGGTAYCLSGGWVVELSGGRETQIVEAARVPVTFGGAADYQISNVMAAVAAARAYGRPVEVVAEALQSYGAQANAGRGNLYRVGRGYVFVDYGHNPEAFAAVGRALKSLKGGRVTAVIGVPGDRGDEVIRQAGRAAAEHFDRLIVREDKDLRGRRSGEAPRLLYMAAEEARPGVECRVVLDEADALELALREMQEGETVAVFYEKLGVVTEVLGRHSAAPLTAAPPTLGPQVVSSVSG